MIHEALVYNRRTGRPYSETQQNLFKWKFKGNSFLPLLTLIL